MGSGANTQARILEAAQQLVVERGVEGFSLREAARRAGITPMAVYRHFVDRQALLQTLAEVTLSDLLMYLQRSLAQPTVRERLESTLRRYVQFALEQPQRYQMVFTRPLRPPHLARKATRTAAAFRFLVDRVREAVDFGLMPQPGDESTAALEALALDLWAQLHGLLMLHWSNKLGMTDEDLFAHLEGTIARMLEP